MPAFVDHFAGTSASYARYRPHYPAALFDLIASASASRGRAWDCGTGSGQAAVPLAERYGEVIATDPSVSQLERAERASGVTYVAMAAERCALAAHSVDLVTVAQALHWFDRPAFFAEVDRVLRPGGALAVWSYGLLSIDPAIDAPIQRLYGETLGPYWPAARALVDSGYAGIELPYPESETPDMTMEVTWSVAQLAGYLSTWSAVGRYRTALGVDPVPLAMREVAAAWGRTDVRRVRWPLLVRVARKGM